MDVEHKKTALDDDSEIYKKRDNSFGKKDIHSLSRKQKLEYFKDYYLKKVLVILVAVVFVGSLLNSMVFHRSTCVLGLALLNESQIEEPEALSEALTEYLDITEKNDYVSVESFNLEEAQMQMAYMAKAAAGGLDAVICPRDYFEEGAERGMFADLREILPEETYTELSDRMLEVREGKDQDEEGNIVSYYEPRPYGIDISDSAHFESLGDNEEEPVLCILQGAVNTSNAAEAITYFVP